MPKTEFIDKKPPSEPGTIITATQMDSLNNQVATGEDFDGSSPLLHGQDIGAANAYAADFVFGKQVSSGTNNSVTAGRLVDGSASFINDAVELGFEVINISDRTRARVVEVISQNELGLDPNIFAATGKKYAVGLHLFQAPLVLTEGLKISFKAANANTGASTLDINGLGTITIKQRDGSVLQAGDIAAGEIVELTYDGSSFLMQLSAADKTKLDGIEAGATGDLSAAEIKTAYESNANTNEYTDAEKTKVAESEPAFAKNTGFNKDIGTTSGTVAEGNHSHIKTSVSGKNASEVNLWEVSSLQIVSCDLGSVAVNDEVDIYFNAIGINGGLDDIWLVFVSKASGTATIEFTHDSTYLRDGRFLSGIYPQYMAFAGRGKVTGAGTLILEARGSLQNPSGSFTINAGDGLMRVVVK